MTDHTLPDYVTIREHTALVERVTRLELAVETASKDNAARYDKILDKMESLRADVVKETTGLRNDIYSYRNGILLRIVGWGVSFVLGGGGMIGLLNAFHLLK